MSHSPIHPLIIIGSGPAGYCAAIYAARAQLAPLVFEGFHSGVPGGQLMTTTEVENYPGFPLGITGPEMMSRFREQAERFGSKMLMEDIDSVDLSERPFKVHASSGSYQAHSLIIATGAKAKRLDAPGCLDGQLWQKGVSACAVCDGAMPLFRDKNLFVIGGGDSAVEEAIFLTKYAKKVFLVHRRDSLRASKIMAKRASEHPKIEILYQHELLRVEGQEFAEKVYLKHGENEREFEAGGLFFAIGHSPNTQFLGNQVKLDSTGYIVTRLNEVNQSETSVEGVFAAGDVQDSHYRQAITAAGSGCMAALDAERWLSEKKLV